MTARYTETYLHVVWSTWRREPFILPSIELALHAYLRRKAKEIGCPLVSIGGMQDHVHLLLRFSCVITIAKMVADLKGSSSHFVNHVLLPGRTFRWQTGYGVFTLRKDEVPIVKNYIENQKEHHRTTIQPLWEPTADE